MSSFFLSLVCWPLANFLPRNPPSSPLDPCSPLQDSTGDFMTCFSLLSVRPSALRPAFLLYDPPTGPKQAPIRILPSPWPLRAPRELILTPLLAGSKGCWSHSNLPQSCEGSSAGRKRSSRLWEGLNPLERKAGVRSKLNKELIIRLLVMDIQ